MTDAPSDVRTERTLAFYADPRAAILLLDETITEMIVSLQIERGVIDLAGLPGLAIAAAFERAGVPFDSLEFGQEDTVDEAAAALDGERLRNLAENPIEIDVAALGAVDANVVLVPAMVGPDEKLIDFSQGTVMGAVLHQLEEAGRDAIVIDTPERGLRAVDGTRYLRQTLHVKGKPSTT